MSHFTVLVPADDEQHLVEILEPWMENCCSTPHLQYMTFHDREDELHEEAKEVIAADSWVGEKNPDAVGLTMLEFYGEGDFAKFCQEWAGLTGKDPIKGRYGGWQNDDAKWDWYVIGGRWTGFLQLKQKPTPESIHKGLVGVGQPGLGASWDRDLSHCDWAPASWIDWDGMRRKDFEANLKRFRTIQKCQAESKEADVKPFLDKYRDSFLEYLEKHEDQETSLEEYTRQQLFDKALSEEKIFLWGPRDDELMDMSEEEFIAKYKANALFFAFVTEGHWVQRAQMGYWGLSRDPNEDYDAAFWTFVKELEESSPEQRVYLVDAHI